jgi:hypothetical protein
MLHRHVLECIFAFLPLPALHAASSVSFLWSTAVTSLPHSPRRLVASRREVDVDVAAMLSSRLAKHVAALGTEGLPCIALDPDQLVQLCTRCPRLTELHGFLALPLSRAPMLLYPPLLRHLKLWLSPEGESSGTHVDNANHIASALRPLAVLRHLEILRLHELANGVSLAPLRDLPLLKSLTLSVHHLRDEFLDGLRALPHLRFVCLESSNGRAFGGQLTMLLREPRPLPLQPLEWQDFGALLPAAEAMTVLQRLSAVPPLTKLQLICGGCVDLSPLQRLMRLQSLTLHMLHTPAVCLYSIRQLSLGGHLAALTELAFVDAERLSVSALTDVLPRMPLLRSLLLERTAGVRSLEWLRSGSLASTLTSLQLVGDWRNGGAPTLLLSDLEHILQLRVLQTLRLCRVVDLTESQRNSFQKLTTFEYVGCKGQLAEPKSA